jgi:hypothetical protein
MRCAGATPTARVSSRAASLKSAILLGWGRFKRRPPTLQPCLRAEDQARAGGSSTRPRKARKSIFCGGYEGPVRGAWPRGGLS